VGYVTPTSEDQGSRIVGRGKGEECEMTKMPKRVGPNQTIRDKPSTRNKYKETRRRLGEIGPTKDTKKCRRTKQ